MLNLLIANLSIQDLEFHLQDIDSVMIDSGLLVYSLCEDMALEEMTIDLPGTIQRIQTVIYHIIRKEFQSNLPRIHGLGYVDFVLSNLKEFQDRYPDSLAFMKTQLQMIQAELQSVQPFLRSVSKQQYNNHDEVQNSVALLIGKAYEVEYIVDACVSKNVPEWCLVLWLVDIIKDIRAEVTGIQLKEMVEVDLVSPYPIATVTSRELSELEKMPGINEKIVGFEDVIETLRYRLTLRSRRLELDIIAIVGMPGAGKTTLAKRLYFDKLVVSHFDIRAQCHVSPVYSQRGLLLSLLAMLHIDETSLHSKETVELADIIQKILRSRRYLILLDDVWDRRVWDDLKRYFPDYYNGSRILLTTRNHDVANNVMSVSESPLHLRFLTYEESWVLLKIKVFGNETCPPLLENVGQEIARKCGGLPLSIVLVAGILSKMDKTEECWSQVTKDLGSYIASDAKAIIEPSYQHLPYHLKPCFLYFGSFLEDKKINISKLIWFWIGEGYVKDHERQSLQDIAEGYLENLINRNLVMDAKRSFDGKIKSCRVHGLLLDFCKQRAEEEHLLLWIKREQRANPSSGICSHEQLVQRRLAFLGIDNLVEWSSSCSPVGSALYSEDKIIDVSSRQFSQMFYNFKFLKVLDLESTVIYSFPTTLVYLRYFSAQTAQDSITSLIADLWNLETLILKPTKGKLKLPVTIWKMVKLRHLCIDKAYFTLNDEEGLLDKLDVLSSPCFSCTKDVELLSRKTPNLRELRCSFVDFRQELFPNAEFFPTRLETLEIHLAADSNVGGPYNFPASLRNLTLSNFFLGSIHKSNISELPNLRVLKLISIFFDNDEWEVRSVDEFRALKVLKLVKCEFFEEWKALNYAFLRLEHLVLRECPYLKEIPSCFQDDNFSLKSIKVKSCSVSVGMSATDILIKQRQKYHSYSKGKKVFIHKKKRDNLSGFASSWRTNLPESPFPELSPPSSPTQMYPTNQFVGPDYPRNQTNYPIE